MPFTKEDVANIARLMSDNIKITRANHGTIEATIEGLPRIDRAALVSILRKGLQEHGQGSGILPDAESEHGLLAEDGDLIVDPSDGGSIRIINRGISKLAHAGLHIDHLKGHSTLAL